LIIQTQKIKIRVLRFSLATEHVPHLVLDTRKREIYLVTPASEPGSTTRFERANRRGKETGRFRPLLVGLAQESVTRVYTLTTKHENALPSLQPSSPLVGEEYEGEGNWQ
jgi:hypothetical protein